MRWLEIRDPELSPNAATLGAEIAVDGPVVKVNMAKTIVIERDGLCGSPVEATCTVYVSDLDVMAEVEILTYGRRMRARLRCRSFGGDEDSVASELLVLMPDGQSIAYGCASLTIDGRDAVRAQIVVSPEIFEAVAREALSADAILGGEVPS